MRMGIDKTLLPVDGEPLVARVVEAAAEACAHILVVTNRPEALGDAGLPDGIGVLADEVAYQGPLGGLATALAHAEDDWVLAVAADMPWLNPDVVRALWASRDGAQVVIPVTEKGPEPLLALYHVSCLPVARKVLESGRRRLVAIFPSVKVAEVPVEQLRAVDPELLSLVNVNTPEDLAEAREAHPVETRKVRATVAERAGRGMPSEMPVTVHMNDVEVATTQATPDALEELGVGFLVAEGLLTDRDALASVTADYKRGLVWVSSAEAVPDDMVYKTRYITSGCGAGVTFSSVGHARGLAPVTARTKVTSQSLYDLVGEMARGAERYRDTGGMHACGLAREGALVVLREDVGRHNAVDKLLGRAWLDRVPTEDAVLLTTGRISYEMAVKAAKARVPIVVSRSAVTDLAAEIADELGMTLVGYARGGRMVVYTHPERVEIEEES
jgi:FdhD protein